MTSFDDLPFELIELIFTFLWLDERLRLGRIDRRCYWVASRVTTIDFGQHGDEDPGNIFSQKARHQLRNSHSSSARLSLMEVLRP